MWQQLKIGLSLVSDTHGQNYIRVHNILQNNKVNPEESAIIILGDAGFNHWGNKSDNKNKKLTSKLNCYIYCVRGNHDERPENLSSSIKIYDENVNGNIYYEEEFPLIRYFIDGEIYEINNHKILVLGGAYSVDKNFRLKNHLPWFPQEQLSKDKMEDINLKIINNTVDFVFSHTCPYSWRPTDLFLSHIDQSSVDTTMEKWLEQLKECFNWGVWCFGHYHDDRIERPYVEQYFQDYENLENIWQRWQKYKETGYLDYWLKKSPNFYMGE